jgi:hypothetical protein
MWREQNDTIFRARFGTLLTDAIRGSFCSSLPRIERNGFRGCMKLKNVMAVRMCVDRSVVFDHLQ